MTSRKVSEYLTVIDHKYDPEYHGIFEGEFENNHFKSEHKWDDFQLHSYQAIKRGDNVLVVAPTSSGKTSVAKYAALYNLIVNNVNVVYITPIKSLSNEKYEEMKDVLRPYGIDPGLLTGDQRINTDSRFMIMTAEILSNMLFASKGSDYTDTIGCLIVDEIHFISDRSRGHVWENILILTDPKVQIIGLSATIDNPERFAEWIGNNKQKKITLVKKYDRPVPLEYYVYDGMVMHKIMDTQNNFNSESFKTATENLKIKKKPITILNNFVKYSIDNELFQLCFICFSKKQCEKFAEAINTQIISNLDGHDAVKELERKMGPYLNDYGSFPCYRNIKKLIVSGVCYHHAGIPVILKEVIEHLYKHGFIKILFATETIAVGVNMPIHTLVFTNTYKSCGDQIVALNAAEFKQISGRAGRRGLDDNGIIVFLPLSESLSEHHVKSELLFGNLPKIKSNLELTYHTFLKILHSDATNNENYFKGSLLCSEKYNLIDGIQINLQLLNHKLTDAQKDVSELIHNNNIQTHVVDMVQQYIELKNQSQEIEFKNVRCNIHNPKKEKKLKSLKKYYDSNKNLSRLLEKVKEIESDILNDMAYLECAENYRETRHCEIINFLTKTGYLNDDRSPNNHAAIVARINECNPFILAEIFTRDILSDLGAGEIVQLISIFTEPINKTNRDNHYFIKNEKLSDRIQCIECCIENYNECEEELGFGSDPGYWDISYDYIQISRIWTETDLDTMDHTAVFTELDLYGEYEGSFIKNMLKINNIIDDLIGLCNYTGNLKLLPVLQEIQPLIIKGIVNADSLHVASFNKKIEK